MKKTKKAATVDAARRIDRAAAVGEVLRSRWSPKLFSARDVDEKAVAGLFESARWAASSFNEQPWNFIVARRAREPEFSRMLDILFERNRDWAQHAPLLILTVARTISPKTGAVNVSSLYELGLAVGNLTAQAVADGMQVHQMGGFDRAKARETFHIPAGFDPAAVIAVGYPDEAPHIRERKPLKEFVFEEEWGRAADAVQARD